MFQANQGTQNPTEKNAHNDTGTKLRCSTYVRNGCGSGSDGVLRVPVFVDFLKLIALNVVVFFNYDTVQLLLLLVCLLATFTLNTTVRCSL